MLTCVYSQLSAFTTSFQTFRLCCFVTGVMKRIWKELGISHTFLKDGSLNRKDKL